MAKPLPVAVSGIAGSVTSSRVLVSDTRKLYPGMFVQAGPRPDRLRTGVAKVHEVDIEGCAVMFDLPLNCMIPAACEGDLLFPWFDEREERIRRLEVAVADLTKGRHDEREAIAAWVEKTGSVWLWSGDAADAAKRLALAIRAGEHRR